MKKPSAELAQELGVSIGTLARAAAQAKVRRRRGRVPERSLSASIVLPEWARDLSTGEFLVAVADAGSVTVRKVRAPFPSTEEPAPTQETWARLADRLAEIELAVAELAGADLIPTRGHVAAVTQSEEHILRSGGFDLSEPPPDAIDPVSRARAEFAKLVSDSYRTEEAAEILGVNSSRVRQRVAGKPRTLFGIKLGHEWRIPRFQFVGKSLVPGFAKVIGELPSGVHPVAVYRWFTTPSPDLSQDDLSEEPVSPLDWLKMGNPPAPVAELASNL